MDKKRNSVQKRAEVFNARALACKAKGDLDGAIELFRQAAATAPKWSAPLYNIGLIHKERRAWEDSLEYNRAAAALDGKDQAAWWNLGIAATALGRWDVARSAWRGFGVKLPPGDGPIDLPCGMCPIRLNPDTSAEVVWAHRLDPARAEIASIPFPQSNHRWKDIVLNDGAPVGFRKSQGQEVPVFNELQLLQASAYGTFVARVHVPTRPNCVEQMLEVANRQGGSAEDWSTSIEVLCKACSEGRPHKDHDRELPPVEGPHNIAIAARDPDHAAQILAAWRVEAPLIDIESLERAL